MTISVSVLTQFKWRCACPAKSSWLLLIVV
jgi:hypothetical protein